MHLTKRMLKPIILFLNWQALQVVHYLLLQVNHKQLRAQLKLPMLLLAITIKIILLLLKPMLT